MINHSIRLIALLTLMATITVNINASQAQSPILPRPTAEVKTDIQKILNLKNQPKELMIDSLFEIKIDSVLNKVSGVTYQDGKASFTSASIDDKGLTLNVNVIDNRNHTLQITASGQSKKGTINVFSAGKYNKNFAGGLNYFWFPSITSANFSDIQKTELIQKIEKIDDYYASKIKYKSGKSEIVDLKALFDTYGPYTYNAQPPGDTVDKYDQGREKLLSRVKKYAKYLPDDFETLPFAVKQQAIRTIVNNIDTVWKNSIHIKELDSLNKVQLSSNFLQMNLMWLSFSAKYNNTKYAIFDQSAVKNLYTRTFNDDYFSATASLNLLWVGVRTTTWLYPTIKFQNSRDFGESDMSYLDVPTGTKIIAGQTVTEYKQTSYYNSVAEKDNALSFEVPLVIFFPKKEFGFDFALTSDMRFKESLGGRFGIYVPIPSGKKNIIVEPLVRVSKILQPNLSLLKEQLSFGLNLTISLPSYIKSNK